MNFVKTNCVIGFVALVLTAPFAHANNWSTRECSGNWGPTAQQAPVYPKRAMERGIEGYIVMGFSVAQDGSVEDITVIDAKPSRAFVRTATKAVESLKFPPCVRDGVAIRQSDVSIKYDFNLN